MKTVIIGAVVALCFASVIPSHASASTGFTVASGFSVNSDEAAAVKAAADSVKKGVPRPGLVVFFSTSGYDSPIVAAQMRKQLPNTRIFGAHSYKAVFSDRGFHRGVKGAIVALGLANPGVAFGLSGTEVESAGAVSGKVDYSPTDEGALREIARQTVLAAAKDAGKPLTQTPSLVLISTMNGLENFLIDAIQQTFGGNVRLVGGTAIDNNFDTGGVFANERFYKHGMVVALVYGGEKSIGNYFLTDYSRSKNALVTATKGRRTIVALNQRPALDVYNDWIGGKLGSRPASGAEDVGEIARMRPLALIRKLPKGLTGVVTNLTLKKTSEGALIQATDVHEGERFTVTDADRKTLIERAGYTFKRAMDTASIKSNAIAGGIQMYCKGAAYVGLAGNETDLSEMVVMLRERAYGRPFIGSFSGAEQGSHEGLGLFLGNFMNSTAVFAK